MKNAYQVGEIVRVLDAPTIEKLFGLDSYGEYKTPHGIVDQMTEQLGEIAKVKEVNSDEIGTYVILDACGMWRWDIDLISRVNPCVGDTVRFKSCEQMIEEFGEDAIWYDTYNAKMIKLRDTNFNVRDMEYLCGSEHKVNSVGEGSVRRLHIGLDWYITSDMVMVVERGINKVEDIVVGQPIPEELIYKPKFSMKLEEPNVLSEYIPTGETKVENINSPKEIVIFEGAIDFSGFSISGKEIQINFR